MYFWAAIVCTFILPQTGESPYKIVKAKEAEQIMQQIVIEQPEEFDQLTSEDVFLGDYYADNVVYDQETYIFDYESIFSPTYSDTAKRKIEELIEAINAKIGPCCEIQDDY